MNRLFDHKESELEEPEKIAKESDSEPELLEISPSMSVSVGVALNLFPTNSSLSPPAFLLLPTARSGVQERSGKN